MNSSKPASINGYNIYPFEHRKHFLDHLLSENNKILIAMNAEKLMNQDKELRELVNKNIGYTDGIGAVYALRKKGIQTEKIPGAEFWLDLIKKYHNSKSFYLIGGKEVVIEETVENLKQTYSGINILNYHHGYFNDDEYQDIIKDIYTKKPDVVFVAMGSPRQEMIMEQLQKYHPALYMGLGGSFDVYTGRVKRAPKIWVDLHLEWAYRLIKQPKRIIRQLSLVKFGFHLLSNKL